MDAAIRIIVGLSLATAAIAFAAPDGKGPPSEFPGNGSGPPQGWHPGNGNGVGGGIGGSGQPGGSGGAGGYVPPAESSSPVNTVPEPSTILLSIAALAILARVSRRR